MNISIELPDKASFRQLGQSYFREALIALLYHTGKLSEQEACLALGLTRRRFEEILPKFGFSILADDPETIQIELTA
jgi:hypothetical protein